MRFRLDAEFGTREFGDRFHRAESPQFQFGAQAAVFLKVVAQGETVALAAMPHLAPFRASSGIFFALSRQRADNFAAGIREFERNAFARVPIAELFFLGSWSGCRCTCDFLAALRATLANHPRHCEKNPALAEINLLSWGPFHRGVIGDLNTWHRFLQSGFLRKRHAAFASSSYYQRNMRRLPFDCPHQDNHLPLAVSRSLRRLPSFTRNQRARSELH